MGKEDTFISTVVRYRLTLEEVKALDWYRIHLEVYEARLSSGEFSKVLELEDAIKGRIKTENGIRNRIGLPLSTPLIFGKEFVYVGK